MPFNIEDKLVITVASSALFDLKESDRIYRERGVDEYRRYQRVNQDVVFDHGIAFPFISRFLALSDLNPKEPPVEVILTLRTTLIPVYGCSTVSSSMASIFREVRFLVANRPIATSTPSMRVSFYPVAKRT